MRKMKLDLKLKNDEQRKSVAKICYDIAKALIIAWLIDCILQNKMMSTTDLKLISVAILWVVAGLCVEESIGRNDNDQP